MKTARIVLAAVGIAMTLYGVGRLLTEIPPPSLVLLGFWLVGALVVHDGLLSPLVLGGAWLLRRLVPVRARAHVQGGLIVAGLVTVVAIPLILRRGTEPVAKAQLQQNYAGNLTVLVAVIAAVTLGAYAVRVARTPPEGTPTAGTLSTSAPAASTPTPSARTPSAPAPSAPTGAAPSVATGPAPANRGENGPADPT